ncbi:MAG: glycosyltransferase [Bryobacteraceae bacterium]
MLHVGKYYPPHRGGIESHLKDLVTAIRPDVDVEVVVAAEGRQTVKQVIEGVPVTRLGVLCHLAGAPVCPEMVSYIAKSPAEIIHMHLPNPMAVLSYLASGRRGDLVISYHSDVVRQKMLAKLFSPFLHKAMERSSRVIATSPDYVKRSEVLARFENRCEVIPFGICLDEFENPDKEKIAEIRREFGPRIVVALGRLVYYKGFDVLIRAMARVKARLVLIGTGPLREELQAEAARHGVSDRVTLLGDPGPVAPYLHAADVFVLPSVASTEAFGIVQLEAMACGKPVINTALDSGVPFVSLHGETGLTVPPGDATALATAINQILDNDALRHRLGQAARRRVEETFTLQSMTQQVLNLYREVATA